MRVKHIENLIKDTLRNAAITAVAKPVTDFSGWPLTGYPESATKTDDRVSNHSNESRQVH
jgi:hypothetical protein